MSAHMGELVGVPLVRHLIRNAPGISFQIVDLAVDSFKRVEEGDLDLCLTISERTLENPVNDVSNWRSANLDRKSVVYGTSVVVRVDLGVGGFIKKKTAKTQ